MAISLFSPLTKIGFVDAQVVGDHVLLNPLVFEHPAERLLQLFQALAGRIGQEQVMILNDRCLQLGQAAQVDVEVEVALCNSVRLEFRSFQITMSSREIIHTLLGMSWV
jgi:hypothetical protein